jgi:hypothetical protein
MPAPSLGVKRQIPLFVAFQERSKRQIAGIGIAENGKPDIDFRRRYVGYGIGDRRLEIAGDIVSELVGPMVARLRILHRRRRIRGFGGGRGCRGSRSVRRRLGRQKIYSCKQGDGCQKTAIQHVSLAGWIPTTKDRNQSVRDGKGK